MQNKCLVQKLLRIKKIEFSISVKCCRALPLNHGKVLQIVPLSLSSTTGTDRFTDRGAKAIFSQMCVIHSVYKGGGHPSMRLGRRGWGWCVSQHVIGVVCIPSGRRAGVCIPACNGATGMGVMYFPACSGVSRWVVYPSMQWGSQRGWGHRAVRILLQCILVWRAPGMINSVTLWQYLFCVCLYRIIYARRDGNFLKISPKLCFVSISLLQY